MGSRSCWPRPPREWSACVALACGHWLLCPPPPMGSLQAWGSTGVRCGGRTPVAHPLRWSRRWRSSAVVGWTT